MESNGFLNALGDFPVRLAGDSIEALVEFRNGEITRGI